MNSESSSWRDSLLLSVDQQRQREVFCDTAIMSSDGRGIIAHACLLAAASPVLLGSLQNQTQPYMLHMTDIPGYVVELVLMFIYTGSIPTEELSQHASILTDVAKILNITPLWNLTKEFQKKLLAVEKGEEIVSAQDRSTSEGFQQLPSTTTLMDDDRDNTDESETEIVQNGSISEDTTHDGGGGEKKNNNDVMIRIDEKTAAMTTGLPVDSSVISTDPGDSSNRDSVSKTGMMSEHQQPVVGDNGPTSTDTSVTSNAVGVSISLVVSPDEKPVTPEHTNTKQATQQNDHRNHFKCTECSKVFLTRRSWKNHQLAYHVTPVTRDQLQGTVPCPLCQKMFTSSGNMRRHFKVHDEITPYRCGFCDVMFTRKSLLNRHEKQHMGNRVVSPDSQSGPPFTCSHCNMSFALLEDLTLHQRADDGDQPLTCLTCGDSFLCRKVLESHELTHTGDFPHRCTVCGKSFRTIEHLNVHEPIHDLDAYKTCAVCSKTFNNACSLRIHMRTHSGERPFLCSHCGKFFTQFSHLKVHSRKHTGEKPYVCDVCGRGFAQTGGLATHRLIHTGEKPHMCPTCGKQFRSSTAYSQHQRIHCDDDGNRTFVDQNNMETHAKKARKGVQRPRKDIVCPTCGKQFRFYSCLYVHLRQHTGEKPYQCPLCSWKFRSSSNMKRHLRTQHYSIGVKPFKCDVCGHAFSRAVQRAVHMKRLHGFTQQKMKTEVNVAVPVTIPEMVPVDSVSEYSTIGTVLDLTAFTLNFGC